MATLCHLSGVDSAIGFNLANVTLFSLTVLGGFGLVYNLVAGVAAPRRGSVPTRAVTARVPAQRVQARAVAAPLPTRRAALRGGVAVVEPERIRPGRGGGHAGGRRSARHAPRRERARRATPAGAAGVPARRPVERPAHGCPRLVPDRDRRQYGRGRAGLQPASDGRHLQLVDPVPRGDRSGRAGARNDQRVPLLQLPAQRHAPAYAGAAARVARAGARVGLAEGGAIRPHDAAGALARRRGLLGAGLENDLRLFVYALVTGSLFIANTWDYPTYLLVVLVALALPIIGAAPGRWRPAPAVEPDEEAPEATWSSRALEWRETRLGSWVTQTAALVALGLLLYLPFHLTFKSLVGGEKIELPPQVAQDPDPRLHRLQVLFPARSQHLAEDMGRLHHHFRLLPVRDHRAGAGHARPRDLGRAVGGALGAGPPDRRGGRGGGQPAGRAAVPVPA